MNRIILVGRNKDFPTFKLHSGAKPGSGGAAALRQSPPTAAVGQGESSAPRWLGAVADALTVSAGLAVFSTLALFFWVIA
tara:strand:- start:363 stop:602 length:240 start_codon:yes stop_codon:yes gene_type:complete